MQEWRMMDFGLDFDIDFQGLDFTVSDVEDGIENQRYSKPIVKRQSVCAYKNAQDLARDIDLYDGFRHFCILSGNFIFGDFIEAMSASGKWTIDRITIHTLTMSQDTIDSLANVIEMDRPSELRIIMSDYWYANEFGKADGLLWELYDKLDIGDGFRLAFCRTHAKVCTIRTKSGHKIVMHGSANMRSHGVIEQFVIENDEGLYDFMEAFNDKVLAEYDTINAGVKRKKPVRRVFEIAEGATDGI